MQLTAAAGVGQSVVLKDKGQTFIGRDSMTADEDLQS